MPRIRWETTGGDIVASSLYFVNWRLADRSVDYLAEDVTPSPSQHYWSLAVEEQFYFVWPLLLLGAVAVRRPARRRPAGRAARRPGRGRRTVPALGRRTGGRLAGAAYFITTTRMWEFTIGAFVAILATRLDRMPRALARRARLDRARR